MSDPEILTLYILVEDELFMNKKYRQISMRQNFPVSYEERKHLVAELICLEIQIKSLN